MKGAARTHIKKAAKPAWNDPIFEEAQALQADIGLIDLHLDAILQQRFFRYNLRKRHKPGVWGQPLFWHSDIPRMKDAAYGGACMGIHYWPWQSEGGWRELNRQIDYLDLIAAEDPRCFRVRTFSDWAHAKTQKLLALAPGVEGAHMLNGRLERVETLAERGVVYLTLTHFSRNDAVSPSMGRGANEKVPITSFGRDLILALNHHGIAVDLAHVNTPGVLSACEVSRAPVFCTHTGVKAIHDAARNISDEEIDAIAGVDGVIGVFFAPTFLSGRIRSTTSTVLDHIEYIVRRVGVRHVAIGSDFDGWLPVIPSDQRDCRDMVKVTAGLIERGFSTEEIGLILRDNAVRVLRAVSEAKTA